MARGIPVEVSMTAERHRLVRERSRISIEIDLIDEWCQALHPKYFTSPQSDSPDQIPECGRTLPDRVLSENSSISLSSTPSAHDEFISEAGGSNNYANLSIKFLNHRKARIP